MERKRVLLNALMTVLQTVVSGVTLFFLYRFLLRAIGVEQLGIWSLILATASVSQIASFGLSGSIVKYVAKYVARDEPEKVSLLVQTAAISVGLLTGVLLLAGYPVVRWVLTLVLPSQSLGQAYSILPFAFVSFWIMMLTGIFQAGLDGFQRIDLRSTLLMAGALIQLFACMLLAPKYGLLGVAYASIVQNLTVFLASWAFIRGRIPSLPVVPYRWDRALFKEIIAYGMKFQFISFLSMFYDPLTKALMSRYGGLSLVGYYEMASKMIYKLRELINSANQTLVPAIAHLHEKRPERIESVYLISRELILYLSLPLYSLIVIMAPAISWIWIGHYEKPFVAFCLVLSVGWFVNTLSIPAYVTYLGIGELNWVVIGNGLVAFLNLTLGLALGILFSGMGVAVARSLALMVGSTVIYLSLFKRIRMHVKFFITKEQGTLSLVCLGTCLLVLSSRVVFPAGFGSPKAEILPILISGAVLFVPFWLNPMRKRMVGWVLSEFPGPRARGAQ